MIELNKIIRDYKHLVFLDFEGTQFSHEMIAIGAVRVDISLKTKHIKKIYPSFKRYVLAKENIGDIVTELTGINENMLKIKGIQFINVQEQLKKYIKIPYQKCLFVTFGSHDIRILNQTLQHNMKANKDDVKIMCHNYFDMSLFLSNYVRDEHGNPYSLQNYLKIFNIIPEGIAHDPSYDALNLAKLYEGMLNNPNILEQHYLELLNKRNNYPYPVQEIMKDILSGHDVNQSTLLEKIKEYIEK